MLSRVRFYLDTQTKSAGKKIVFSQKTFSQPYIVVNISAKNWLLCTQFSSSYCLGGIENITRTVIATAEPQETFYEKTKDGFLIATREENGKGGIIITTSTRNHNNNNENNNKRGKVVAEQTLNAMRIYASTIPF